MGLDNFEHFSVTVLKISVIRVKILLDYWKHVSRLQTQLHECWAEILRLPSGYLINLLEQFLVQIFCCICEPKPQLPYKANVRNIVEIDLKREFYTVTEV